MLKEEMTWISKLQRREYQGMCSSPIYDSIFLSFLFFCIFSFAANDTMIPGQKLSGSQTLISAGGEFVLGFFSPGESNDRYIGIWYNQLQTDTKTVVWVANRDNPVVDPDGAFVLGEDGNLAVVEGSGNPIWYSIRDSGSASVVNAILLDSGNLVLKAGRDITWESFGDPTDTVVPGMKIRYYPPSYIPTSWKNQTDPGTGGFSFSIDPLEHKQVIILWNSKLYWESGIWDGNIFQKIQEVDKSFVFHFTMNGSGTDDVYVTYLTSHKYTRLVIDSSGELQFLIWFEPSKQWRKVWTTVKDKCIAACGPNTHCSNDNNSVVCSCLPGFQPVLPWHWDSGNWVDGCRRKESPCWKEDKFVPLTEVAVYNESSFENNLREDECQSLCHAICSCIAYAYSETRIGDSRCQIFKDKGMDFRVGAAKGGLDIYLRLSSSQPNNSDNGSGSHKKKKPSILLFSLPIILGTVLIVIVIYLWMMAVKRKGKMGKVLKMILSDWGENAPAARELLEANTQGHGEEGPHIPFIRFETIVTATDNFSESNKLGQGGFGPVYKGILSGGKEIAVKRLSKSSGQGLEEFKNEVILIAKLQHRNLVRLVGCCIHGDEKMLLYEYMANKSLDFFLFDKSSSMLIDWERRFIIILGVARGLLYLHQDSRLRIIHRDLKAINILLDEEMNPKISDFGLARIFGGKQTQANTNRVVGTYGYMSPEYALDGLFSIKSDIFSFGVVMLEIISGKKNTSFYNAEHSLNLLGHAWKLWMEDNGLDLVDPLLRETCNESEVSKCICVGLLCVQEDPKDRPTMASVLTMLDTKSPVLPTPKKPAFVTLSHTNTSSENENNISNNNINIEYL